VRSPADLGPRPFFSSRRRVFIIVGVLVLIVLLFSLRSLAILWTDELWFSSVGRSDVFSTLLEVKLGLFACFGVFFFALLFGNLMLTDRLGARNLSLDAEDEIVRRYQALVRPYARRVYALIAIIAGIIAGLTAIGQWNNYVLFANAQSFHQTDPVFHKDIGFYVFKLPFMTFVVDWLIGSLIAVILLSAFFHYLNGGIRATRLVPRVAASVKVHLSVLLAAVAIMKALGYIIAKWQLVVSTNGYVEGAGYADIHARIPALTILFFLSLTAAAILLANIRSRGWSLPALAIGLWLFVAIVIGYIYPAVLQAFKVTPAQSTLELPYVQRNITATRYAFGLDDVKIHTYTPAATLTATQRAQSAPTLANISIWDPSNNISLETVQRLQSIRAYYDFDSMTFDRYTISSKLTPVLISTRQINESALASPSWVNTHLVYTHGIGAVILPANLENSEGQPVFDTGNVPPTSGDGLPALTQPDIYFGTNLPGWVVADSREKEVNYVSSTGPIQASYSGGGGVAAGGFFQRAAFALRFDDLNMLISDDITSTSRVIFVRNVLQMAQKAAPFISWSNQPYPVVTNGDLYYVLDGFTTTSEYPYSENASNQNVASSGGLPGSYNYIRNSVKLVVNAYTGKMNFFAFDPNDPILEAYRAAFPNMFQPESSMVSMFPEIVSHLRYPSALLAIQAATLGRYHITVPSSFYSASNQWEVTPTVGAGRPDQALAVTTKTNSAGAVISSTLSPMTPEYEVMALPGSTGQQLVLMTAFVPAGNASTVQSLSAFMTASSDPGEYGVLNIYETPPGKTTDGPLQADSYIEQKKNVSETISLLDTNGSQVLLGNILLIPIGNSILYERPMYVTSTSNPLPELVDVITVFGQKVGFAPTLAGSLAQTLGTAAPTSPTKPSTSSVKTDLANAQTEYNDALAALTAGNLSAYQKDFTAMDRDIQLAQSALTSK
jgi:uncharacterized protein